MRPEGESYGGMSSGDDDGARWTERAGQAFAALVRRGRPRRRGGALVCLVAAGAVVIGVVGSQASDPAPDTSPAPTVTREDGDSTFRPPPIRPTQVPYPLRAQTA